MNKAHKGRIFLDGAKMRRAYRAGFADGLREAEKRLTCCVQANSQLWQEVLRLDDDCPVGGTGVLLPRQFAETLMAALGEPGPHERHQVLLGRYVVRANEGARELVEKLQSLSATV